MTEPGLTQSSGISDHFRAYRSDPPENSGKSTCAERAILMENNDHNICQTTIVR